MLLSIALLLSCTPTAPYDNDADDDGSPDGLDCAPNDPDVGPDIAEIPYDGVDQDCDGSDLVDVDGDAWDAIEAGGDDCDDADPTVNPAASEVPYNGVDEDCIGGDRSDVDDDGFDAVEGGGEDCNDQDASVHPGALDDCGGGDEDCDGTDDEDQDLDDDGHTRCQGDCNDEDASVYPGAPEVAQDGIDQNCNGVDMGACPADVYTTSFNLWVRVSGSCDGTNNIYGYSSDSQVDSSWYVPEDASCTTGNIEWDGSMGFSTSSVSDAHFAIGINVAFGAFNTCGSITGGDWQSSGADCGSDLARFALWGQQACIH